MTVTEFLLARIAEDEAAATRAAKFRYDHPSDSPWARARIAVERGGAFSSDPHVARWDPARVLAECEAKRRIVEGLADNPTVSVKAVAGFTSVNEWALRALAAIYADHPDYQQEWRV